MLNSSVIEIIVYFANHTQLPNVRFGACEWGLWNWRKKYKTLLLDVGSFNHVAMGGSVTCM